MALSALSYFFRVLIEGDQGALPLTPARGAASGLRKGLRPLTLSRDSVGDTFRLCPRVYAGFRVCGRDSPCFTTMMKLFYCPTQLKFFIIHQSRQDIPIELHQPPHNLLHIQPVQPFQSRVNLHRFPQRRPVARRRQGS